MLKNAISSALVLPAMLANIAFAEPVYLDCSVTNSEGETTEFSVMADEAGGKITHTNAGGGAFNADGFFAANSIAYKQVVITELMLTWQYDIDRTTLAVTQTFNVKPADPEMALALPGSTLISTGSCSVVDVSSRKI